MTEIKLKRQLSLQEACCLAKDAKQLLDDTQRDIECMVQQNANETTVLEYRNFEKSLKREYDKYFEFIYSLTCNYIESRIRYIVMSSYKKLELKNVDLTSLMDAVFVDCMTKIHKSINRYKTDKENPIGWISVIVTNQTISAIRSEISKTNPLKDDIVTFSKIDNINIPNVEEYISSKVPLSLQYECGLLEDSDYDDDNETRIKILKSCLEQLPETMQDIFYKIYNLDKKGRDVAEELGMNYETLRTKIFRARNELKALYELKYKRYVRGGNI